LVEIPSDRPVQVIGDSHGDWPAVSAALGFARSGHVPERFVGLGDYIHRWTRSQPDPTALPSGSVWNAAYLLAWTALDPQHVILLRGNHEATRQIPVPGPTLLRELRRAYPRAEALPLWSRIVGLLERLPLAGRTANGVFLVHGGIPPPGRFDPISWKANELALLEGLLWSDPQLDYEDRSVGFAYGARDLEAFLRAVHCRVMIKGHAPGHSGRAIYGGKLLTIHTSDLFRDSGDGGVLLAEIPGRPRVEDASEITLRVWEGGVWRSRPVTIVPDHALVEAPPRPSAGASPQPTSVGRY
jgi:Calcineurin-like phosphoesterase